MSADFEVLLVFTSEVEGYKLGQLFEHLGCQVAHAQTAHEAIDQLTDRLPSLLVLDGRGAFSDVLLHGANFDDLTMVAVVDDLSQQLEHIHAKLVPPITMDQIEPLLEQKKEARVPILDDQVLENMKVIAEDDEEFLVNLIQMFLERVPGVLKDMELALQTKDPKRLERSSHSLKGSAGNIGAKLMMNQCQQLEEWGRKGLTDEACVELFEQVSENFLQVKELLEKNWLKKVS